VRGELGVMLVDELELVTVVDPVVERVCVLEVVSVGLICGPLWDVGKKKLAQCILNFPRLVSRDGYEEAS